jgi:hypothetical protein
MHGALPFPLGIVIALEIGGGATTTRYPGIFGRSNRGVSYSMSPIVIYIIHTRDPRRTSPQIASRTSGITYSSQLFMYQQR